MKHSVYMVTATTGQLMVQPSNSNSCHAVFFRNALNF